MLGDVVKMNQTESSCVCSKLVQKTHMLHVSMYSTVTTQTVYTVHVYNTQHVQNRALVELLLNTSCVPCYCSSSQTQFYHQDILLLPKRDTL